MKKTQNILCFVVLILITYGLNAQNMFQAEKIKKDYFKAVETNTYDVYEQFYTNTMSEFNSPKNEYVVKAKEKAIELALLEYVAYKNQDNILRLLDRCIKIQYGAYGYKEAGYYQQKYDLKTMKEAIPKDYKEISPTEKNKIDNMIYILKNDTDLLIREYIAFLQQMIVDNENYQKQVFDSFDQNSISEMSDYISKYPNSLFYDKAIKTREALVVKREQEKIDAKNAIVEEKKAKDEQVRQKLRTQAPYKNVSNTFWNSHLFLRENVVEFNDDVTVATIFINELNDGFECKSFTEHEAVYESVNDDGSIARITFMFERIRNNQILISEMKVTSRGQTAIVKAYEDKLLPFTQLLTTIWKTN